MMEEVELRELVPPSSPAPLLEEAASGSNGGGGRVGREGRRRERLGCVEGVCGLAARTLLKVSAFGALGGFLFGYDLALIGGALLVMDEELQLADWEQETIVGCAKLGAVLGTFVGGALMQCYGRRRTISLDGLFFVFGPLLMAASGDTLGLSMGRLIIGVGIGVSAVVVPAYVAEMAPAPWRGVLVSLYEAMLCVGMLAATLVDFALRDVPGSWRWMVAAPAVPAVLMMLTLHLLPESPHWLLTQMRLREAFVVFHALRADAPQTDPELSTPEVEQDFLELYRTTLQHLRAQQVAHTPDVCNGDSAAPEPPPSMDAQPSAAAAAPEATARQGEEEVEEEEAGAAMLAEEEPLAARSHSWQSVEPRLEERAAGSNVVRAPPLGEAEADAGRPPGAAAREEREQQGGHGETPSASTSRARQAETLLRGDGQLLGGLLRREAARSGRHCEAASGEERAWEGVDGALQGNSLLGTWRRMGQQIVRLHRSQERRAFGIALGLAFFNQITASTSIINYAPAVLWRMGVESHGSAMLLSSVTGLTKLVGVLMGMTLVDSLGRKPLLMGGSVGCAVAMVVLRAAVADQDVTLALAAMCAFLFAFSVSWANGFWVLISEMFSMESKSAASSVATALLFACGAGTDFLFLSMADWLESDAYLVYAFLATLSAAYVLVWLPETKGRTLAEVQALLSQPEAPSLSWIGRWPSWLSPSKLLVTKNTNKFVELVELET